MVAMHHFQSGRRQFLVEMALLDWSFFAIIYTVVYNEISSNASKFDE